MGVFFGEFICLLVYYAVKMLKQCKSNNNRERRVRFQDNASSSNVENNSSKFNPIWFAIPAFCDMLASSGMLLGLNYTYASSYQMLRGSVVIFATILTRVLLLDRFSAVAI